jgi:hypothetical protein
MDQQEISAETLSRMSVRELKDILRNKRIDFTGAVEKTDLIQLILENSEKPDSNEENILGSGISAKNVNFVGMNCEIVSNTEKPNYIAIVWYELFKNILSQLLFYFFALFFYFFFKKKKKKNSHGFGASNSDLATIGKHLLQSSSTLKKEKWMFVFPNAIIQLSYGSHCWWHLDMQKLIQQVMMGQLDQMFGEIPVGLHEARQKIFELIKDLKTKYSLSSNRIVLAGFSQGSVSINVLHVFFIQVVVYFVFFFFFATNTKRCLLWMLLCIWKKCVVELLFYRVFYLQKKSGKKLLKRNKN